MMFSRGLRCSVDQVNFTVYCLYPNIPLLTLASEELYNISFIFYFVQFPDFDDLWCKYHLTYGQDWLITSVSSAHLFVKRQSSLPLDSYF